MITSGQNGVDIYQIQNVYGQPMQDRYFIQVTQDYIFATLFDGTGLTDTVKECDAAKRLQTKGSEYFFQEFEKNNDVKQSFNYMFQSIERELFVDYKEIMKDQVVGCPYSSAACIFINKKNNTAYVAHIGNSRVLLIDGKRQLKFCTQDHTPANTNELERIKNNKGIIEYHNEIQMINGSIISRLIGGFNIKNTNRLYSSAAYDVKGEGVVTADCEYQEIQLAEDDQIFMVSRGLIELYDQKNEWITSYKSAQELIKVEKYNKGSNDMTAIIIPSWKNLKKGIFQFSEQCLGSTKTVNFIPSQRETLDRWEYFKKKGLIGMAMLTVILASAAVYYYKVIA